MFHISNIYTLKSISYAYVNSIIKYETNFWGNTSNNGKIFTSQRKSSELWLVHNQEPLAVI